MIIEIAPDLHNERAGYYRAYTTDALDAPTRCPVLGYATPGGSYRTMTGCIQELRHHRICIGMPVYSHTGRRLGTI